ncbi:TIGR01777 family oxidoreductase [Corynebacterium hindlerae]|uniref:TIGR01777 family oxidoreductase n=1 Tax=Corynebacterium hindlerae TaxID=699041 RepID=UPI0031B6BCA8
MSYTTTQFLPFDRATVWEYHTRKGAITRLSPPFLPMTPVRQANSLADGTTIFSLPAGLKWIARHDITAYRGGRQFADECVSAPFKAFAQWRHVHRFADVEGGCTVTDVVETRVPSATVRATFAYRQTQLLGDLTTAARLDTRPLTVAMTGSRGLVGRALSALLSTMGVMVVQLVRDNVKEGQRHWNPHAPAADLLDGVDALIHLAGEPIGGRFTDSHKALLVESRVEPTAKLAELVSRSETCQAMISASAVGFYGTSCGGDAPVTVDSPAGSGFLADLVQQWEASAATCTKRTVLMRTGLVLSGRGGLLPVFKALFSTGLGGPLGTGEQWMSWVAIDDLLDMYATALFSSISGPVNAVAPQPVRNTEFAESLAKELRRPALLNVPSFGPKLLLGKEGTTELALADQRVATSFEQFRFPALSEALAHELGGHRA